MYLSVIENEFCALKQLQIDQYFYQDKIVYLLPGYCYDDAGNHVVDQDCNNLGIVGSLGNSEKLYDFGSEASFV